MSFFRRVLDKNLYGVSAIESFKNFQPKITYAYPCMIQRAQMLYYYYYYYYYQLHHHHYCSIFGFI